MIELRDMNEYEAKVGSLVELPIEVCDKIKRVLITIEEAYGALAERAYVGGVVIILENQDEVRGFEEKYDLTEYEVLEIIETAQGKYIYMLFVEGTENNIAIFVKHDFIKL